MRAVHLPRTTEPGVMGVEALKKELNGEVAGVMLTCPNTLGLFNPHIREICEIADKHCDGYLRFTTRNRKDERRPRRPRHRRPLPNHPPATAGRPGGWRRRGCPYSRTGSSGRRDSWPPYGKSRNEDGGPVVRTAVIWQVRVGAISSFSSWRAGTSRRP